MAVSSDSESSLPHNGNNDHDGDGDGDDDCLPVDSTVTLENDNPDTLRILLSTDNHLGYSERDNVRGMDSFAAFEEVLYIAQRFHVDLVLIGGDLFHENRPSRRTLHKTMEILRRYCLGPDAVRVELLSESQYNGLFRSGETVNYQDPNFAVQLPVFSIHGNHDDPSRDQGGDLLAALDLLAVSNLVNYFGRQDDVDKVEISPILLKKGSTKIALYGLGALRDERLNRMWERQKVRFLRPDNDEEEDDDGGGGNDEDFFNIFTLHQNRDLGRGSKNCVQESMIPEWMDLVVWGHEHECLIDPFESVVGTFRITQPGSSVATSLVSGEAARKKIGLLEINQKDFRVHPIPLTQVRSFVTTELSLREHRSELDPDDPRVETKMTKVLNEEVQLMVANARQKREEILKDASKAGSDAWKETSPLKYRLQNPDEVLVRIRVEHHGFSTLNNQRFGAKFCGDCANPNDILLFHRKKDPKLASTIKKKGMEPVAPEELERTNMEDLVREHLSVPNAKLMVLGEKPLSEALDDFVEKSVISAIPETAKRMLTKATKNLIKQRDGEQAAVQKESQVIDILEASQQEEVSGDAEKKQSTKKNNKKPAAGDGKENSLEEEEEDEEIVANSQTRKPKRTATASSRSNRSTAKKKPRRKTDFSSDDDDDDVVMEEAPPKPARRRPARGSTAKRKDLYSVDSDGGEDEDSDAIVDYDDEDDDVLVVEERPKKRKGAAKRAKAAPSSRKTTATSRAKGRKTSRRNQLDDSDDSDVEFVGQSAPLDVDWGSAATKSQR